MSNFQSKATDDLFEAILSLQSVDECYKLFEDLCTIVELQAITQRYEVAQLLKKGMKYGDIVAATGASTTTISRVNRCLNYGSGGYKLVLERVEENADKR